VIGHLRTVELGRGLASGVYALPTLSLSRCAGGAIAAVARDLEEGCSCSVGISSSSSSSECCASAADERSRHARLAAQDFPQLLIEVLFTSLAILPAQSGPPPAPTPPHQLYNAVITAHAF